MLKLRSCIQVCACLVVTVISLLSVQPGFAQTYPAKPVRMVLGYAPGGGADALARLISQRFADTAGQPAFVENRPGASALLAIQAVATAPADGYTLLVMANSSVLAQALSALRGTPAHDIERDLAPVSAVAIQPLVLLVNPALPVKSVKEFVALVKAKPNAVNYGSSGIGGASHLAGELFNLLADVKLFHVPYKGGSESVVAAAAGTIQATFASTTSAKALMDSGKLRPLAVTSLNRTQLLPSAPSVNESGVAGYDAVVWYAVMVPTAVPAPIVGQLNTILAKIVMAPDMKEPFLRQGLEPQSGSPQQLRTMIRNEFVQSIKLIKAADLKPDQ